MRKQKENRQKDILTVVVTQYEKNVLTRMALDQNIRVENLAHDLIFSSGLISVLQPTRSKTELTRQSAPL
jgi:hypothetical protein